MEEDFRTKDYRRIASLKPRIILLVAAGVILVAGFASFLMGYSGGFK